MDGFSGYTQIKMYPDDKKHTAFSTLLEVYCYMVMPFGLKNIGATYQCTISAIFKEHLDKTKECYVDNLAIKSKNKEEHLRDLQMMLDLMRKHQLKMNPTKSVLGVSSGKFLGF